MVWMRGDSMPEDRKGCGDLHAGRNRATQAASASVLSGDSNVKNVAANIKQI
jgi:hypothetical protein